MFNRFLFFQIILIAVLSVFQAFIFSRFNIGDQYNPFIYLLWLLFFPNSKSYYLYLILAFILGISVDILMGTGGLNAFACVFVAMIRNFLLRFTMGGQKDLEMLRWNESNFLQILVYIFLGTFVHQFILFYLEKFTINAYCFLTLMHIFISSLITTLCVFIFFNLFKNRIVE